MNHKTQTENSLSIQNSFNIVRNIHNKNFSSPAWRRRPSASSAVRVLQLLCAAKIMKKLAAIVLAWIQDPEVRKTHAGGASVFFWNFEQ